MSDPEPPTSSTNPPRVQYDWETEADGIVVVDSDTFNAIQFPPRAFLLEPILQTKQIAMLYGPRGIGKTFAAVGIAIAVSDAKSFFRWTSPFTRSVLYIDGELPQELLQERLRLTAASMGASLGPFLRLITPDQQTSAIPNLADTRGQEILGRIIDREAPDLVILDSLSTLCRGGEENSAESWQPVQDFLVKQRSQGRSVLLIHHGGKSGEQRGTSKREDVLDLVIRLSRPDDYTPEQGARFEVHYEKARSAIGDAVAPFEAKLEGSCWTMKSLANARDELIRRLYEEGLTQREIAKQGKCSLGTVNKALKGSGPVRSRSRIIDPVNAEHHDTQRSMNDEHGNEHVEFAKENRDLAFTGREQVSEHV